jgi:glycosyltransferase involved in cell wall biosynthesis
MEPKVSVVMLVLNGRRFIREAIESIVAQTYRNLELVVVDDGSTDGTGDIVKLFMSRIDIRYVRHSENRGIAFSVNDGIRNTTGDMISFLDHDDLWFPNFVETQIRYLEEHPDVGMVHSDFRTIDAEGKILEESMCRCRNIMEPSGHIFRDLFMRNRICANTVMIRRECLTRCGGFDERLRWGDYHLWMRISRHYKIDFVPEVLTCYRQHATQSTRSDPDDEPVPLQALRYIIEQYPEVPKELGERVVRQRMASLYLDLAYKWHERGRGDKVRANLGKAIRLWPLKPRFYALYAGSLLRPSHATMLADCGRRLRTSFLSAKVLLAPILLKNERKS